VLPCNCRGGGGGWGGGGGGGWGRVWWGGGAHPTFWFQACLRRTCMRHLSWSQGRPNSCIVSVCVKCRIRFFVLQAGITLGAKTMLSQRCV
jgi:hypothetical protein